MKEIKSIIFDMDGLMFDTERVSTDSWVRVGEEYGFPITRKLIDDTRGRDRRVTSKILESELGEKFDFDKYNDISRGYMDDYFDHHGLPKKKGLDELLDYLRDNGFTMAVASSSERARVNDYLDRANVADYFCETISGDEIGRGKPNPDIFLKALDKLGVEANQALVIEDSGFGIEAAHRAEIRSILVPDMIEPSEETLSLATYRVDSLLDVIDLLKQE